MFEVDIGRGGHIFVHFMPVHSGGVEDGGYGESVDYLVSVAMFLYEGVQGPDVEHDVLRHSHGQVSVGDTRNGVELAKVVDVIKTSY